MKQFITGLAMPLAFAAQVQAQSHFSSSESYVATSTVTPSAAVHATSAGFVARLKLGMVPSGNALESEAYAAWIGTADHPADFSSGVPVVFGTTPVAGSFSEPIRVHGFALADGSNSTQVEIGGTPATSSNVVSNTSIDAVLGDGVSVLGNPLGKVGVTVTTLGGSAELPNSFVYGPALVGSSVAQVDSVYELEVHLETGDLYQVFLSLGSGLNLPINPLAGVVELNLPTIDLTPFSVATDSLVSLGLPVPDDQSLVNVLLNLQAVVIESVDPLAGSFTNRLETQVQP